MDHPSNFPSGLRVLVVDDDPTWLKILEKMLRKCSYEVTTCGLARIALEILRERKNKFDIVISDVNMPDMDGFKLLEHIGLEMDLPVIMMSIDGETSRVMKGVQHGACDYLLKPVRMKELKNIWQHVYRKKKRMHEAMKDIEGHDSCDDLLTMLNGCDGMEEKCVLNRGESCSIGKRKDPERDCVDPDVVEGVTVKKARVVWSVDLHQKFVDAVNQIGIDKVGPKKILDLMNVPGLTRENVASHLQKYRLYLSRLTNNNKVVAVAAANNSHLQKGGDVSPLDKSVVSFQTIEPMLTSAASDSTTMAEHQPWHDVVPKMTAFLQYPKHNHERCDMLEDYSCLPKQDLDRHPVAVTPISVLAQGGLSLINPEIVARYSFDGLTRLNDCSQAPMAVPPQEEQALSSSDMACFPEDLQFYSLQEIGLEGVIGLEVFQCGVSTISTPLTDMQGGWHDSVEFCPESSTDYPLIDECLFA